MRHSSLSLEGTALADEPLTSRGWALQERVLSTRVLHFAKDQLIWECKHMVEFENGLEREPQPFRWQPTNRNAVVLVWRGNEEAWRSIVEQYSGCILTNPRDRLPAISGIARTFQTENPGIGEYLAGHWECYLPYSLMWYLRDKEEAIGSASWSWASKTGKVWFQTVFEPDRFGRIVGFDVHADKSNPFGEVQYGRLDIEAPVIRVHNLHGQGNRFDFCLALDDGNRVFTGQWLTLDTDDIPKDLYLLILMLELDNCKFSGLLITPTGSTENQYQRVGMFKYLKDLTESQLSPARTISLI